jgi:hypothetical protein
VNVHLPPSAVRFTEGGEIMRIRIHTLAAGAALLATSCITYADDDHDRDRDRDRAKAEARAERECEREAEDRGLRVRRVGDVERVGKREYEVSLRVDERDYDRDDRRKKKDDDFRVRCRYDDRSRRASIY